jgi:hypothetical protein
MIFTLNVVKIIVSFVNKCKIILKISFNSLNFRLRYFFNKVIDLR